MLKQVLRITPKTTSLFVIPLMGLNFVLVLFDVFSATAGDVILGALVSVHFVMSIKLWLKHTDKPTEDA